MPGGRGVRVRLLPAHRSPWRGESPGRRRRLGQTGDVMTDPDWRKRGLFSDLDRACMATARSEGWPVSIGFPNRRSAHIFIGELGWERVGTLRPWTHYLRTGAAEREWRRREGRLAGALLPLTARACRRARARLGHTSDPRSFVEDLEAFPAEVTALAERISERHALFVRRDAEYLDWRFLRAPSGLHRAIAVRDPFGQLSGYVVVQVPRAGEAVGYLVDLLGLEDEDVATAMRAGLSRLELEGAGLVRATAIEGSWWEARLAEAGFLASKPEDHLAVIAHVHDEASAAAAAVRDASRWYFTDGDRDDETMG